MRYAMSVTILSVAIVAPWTPQDRISTTEKSCAGAPTIEIASVDETSNDQHVLVACAAAGDSPAVKLNANDVSWLFPLPKTATDVTALIPVAELKSTDDKPVLSEADFSQLVAIAESSASKIKERQIKFKDEIKDIKVWKIAGIRFDPSAPGCSDAVANVFGRSPQLRLVVQPVTGDSNVTVHDMALHLVFSYVARREETESGVIGKVIPEEGIAKKIVEDLLRLKKLCEDANVDTDGTLSVHPGLKAPDKVPKLRQEVREFLNRHLHASRLNAAAVMGIHNAGSEPWIFVAMLRNPPATGEFVPGPSPGIGPIQNRLTANMLSFMDDPNVQPTPSTTNRSPTTGDLRIQGPERRGTSTAVLFTNEPLDTFATIGVDGAGTPVKDSKLKNSDISDWIAHPEHCHFFNTDCVSCHTETTRRAHHTIDPSEFAFKQPTGVSLLDPQVSPRNRWNVRNFGWFKDQPTITQRTANETAEVVDFINRSILGP